jgi:hypothetical protein
VRGREIVSVCVCWSRLLECWAAAHGLLAGCFPRPRAALRRATGLQRLGKPGASPSLRALHRGQSGAMTRNTRLSDGVKIGSSRRPIIKKLLLSTSGTPLSSVGGATDGQMCECCVGRTFEGTEYMTNRNQLKALYVLCAVALAACGGGGDETATAGTPPTSAPSPAPTPAPAPGPAPAPPPASLSTATLQWSAPSDSRVQGYRVYYGTSSRAYQQTRGAGLDSGSTTQLVVSNLQSGRTYYFAVTSYDAAGNESDYSNEVTKQIN